jgi:D-tyrosyl-tRNA(Tyr) deacylase
MRAVIQRVKAASVLVEGKIVGAIDKGLLVLVGIETEDTFNDDAEWLIKKLPDLRIFDDHEGNMNLSLMDINGSILLVSQFTLCGSTKKGNRPSFINAMRPEPAEIMFNQIVEEIKKRSGLKVETGLFGANMDVRLNNYGPVTIIMDTKNKI